RPLRGAHQPPVGGAGAGGQGAMTGDPPHRAMCDDCGARYVSWRCPDCGLWLCGAHHECPEWEVEFVGRRSRAVDTIGVVPNKRNPYMPTLSCSFTPPNAASPRYVARSSDGSCVDVGASLDSFVSELCSRWKWEDGDVAVWMEAEGASRLVAVVRAGAEGEAAVSWLGAGFASAPAGYSQSTWAIPITAGGW